MSSQIKIIIDIEGNVKTEVNGVVGSKCLQSTEFLKGLGGESEIKLKQEYYQQAKNSNKNQQK